MFHKRKIKSIASTTVRKAKGRKYNTREFEEIQKIFNDSATLLLWKTAKVVALFTSHLSPLFHCITAFHSSPRIFVARDL